MEMYYTGPDQGCPAQCQPKLAPYKLTIHTILPSTNAS